MYRSTLRYLFNKKSYSKNLLWNSVPLNHFRSLPNMSTTVKRESTDNNTAKPSIKRNKSVKSEAVNGSVDAPASAPPTADDATLVPDLEDCGFEDSELPKPKKRFFVPLAKLRLLRARYLQLRASLLAWYDENHRILPWRRNPHSRLSEKAIAKAAAEGSKPAPEDLCSNDFIYYVWVCEIMSQQTQVSRAAEYFRKWISKWPNVASLASATQEEVNEMWAGLGYYRRARYLLMGAKYIVNDLAGAFPTTAKELSKIPGVGAYTSNAIASIACGERVAVVDGNVIRVLARLRRLKGDPRSSTMTKLFAELASQALDPERPGDFNQAVMELGATVCVPNTTPSCESCPVSHWCKARQAEKQFKLSGGDPVSVTDYPTKVEKADKREELVAVAVVRVVSNSTEESSLCKQDLEKFVLVRRPEGGLLAGLLEFPMATIKQKSERGDAINKLISDLLGIDVTGSSTNHSDGGGITVLERKDIGETVHIFSHIRMTMYVEKIVIRGPSSLVDGERKHDGELADEDRQMYWYSAEELESKGLSSGVKKVYKMYSAAQSKEKAAKTQGIQKFFKPLH